MITVADLFCGAGGSALGVAVVPGVELRYAANHWRRAVETHAANFPHVDHDVADISQVDPRRTPRTDILWASPECTNHSQAKGRKRETSQPDLFGETLPDEAAVRSRATMWDVPRFAEHHRYRAVIVENVVEAARWEMCTPVSEPARSFTTAGHQSLVGWPSPAPAVEDCTFRMLEPAEIQTAMAFRSDYRVHGTRREQVRQLGNAVTPPAAEWLIRAVVTSLAGAAQSDRH